MPHVCIRLILNDKRHLQRQQLSGLTACTVGSMHQTC